MDINVLCENPAVASALKGMSGIETIYDNVMPYVMREKDTDMLKMCLSGSNVVVRTWDELGFVMSSGYKGRIIADSAIYTFNRSASDFIKNSGIWKDTVPLELNVHEILERGASSSELVVYGKVPMMVTAQCFYRNTHNDSCSKDTQKGHEVIFTDRTGTQFSSVCFCRYCYNVLFNSVPLSLHSELDMIRKIAPASVRLYFTTEKEEEAVRTAEYFVRLFNGEASPGMVPYREYTRGHFRKGVE